MEITVNSTTPQTSPLETDSQAIGSTKVIRKTLSAYWVMENGKLTCKWLAE
jgi:hypothetical protein